ncbi:hypothetical protein WNY78_13875 [Psychroserpens sp. AS72]|uniref:hypothetical protein n=1 Tax=Psychroserpens sp. AS72 TaxID=3135775 RepID=UPI00316BB0A0
MKKLFALLLFSAVLMFQSCEDEPLEGDFGTGGLTCEVAVANTTQAALNFLSVNVDNYTQLCTAYRNALQAQILACGDADGSLQAAVNALGDCSDSVGSDCDNAQDAVDNAEFAFDNATADNYTSLCNAYKVALENEIVQCGDEDGSIQAEIDALGDCTQVVPQVEISVFAGTLLIEFDMVNVVIDGNILKVTGETSLAANYMVYFEIEQGQTGVDVINSTFELTLTSVFFPSTQGFEDYTSNITVNTDGVLTGTFGGVVTNADGGDLSLSSGMINITY